MSDGSRVLRAVMNYGLGSYVPQLVNFLLVPVYTRYISPEEMGILESAFGIQLLLVVTMRLGLPGALARSVLDVEDNTPQFRNLIFTLAASSTISSLFFAFWAFVFGPMLVERWFPELPFFPYVTLAIIGSVVQVSTDLQRRLLQARELSGESARLSAVMAVSTTVLTVLLVIGMNLGALGALSASFVVSCAFSIWAVVRHWQDLQGKFETSWLKSGLSYGLPLVPNYIAAWLQQNLGRFFLLSVGSAAYTGLLAVAGKVASPISVVTGAFSNAYSPVYFSWRAKLSSDAALKEARQIGNLVSILGAIAVLGAGTLGSWVMQFLMSDVYRAGASLVGLIAAALYFHLLYTLVSMEVFYSKRTQVISMVFGLAALTNGALVWALTPRFGVVGAALSQAIGGVVSLAVITTMAVKTFPLPLEKRAVAFSWLAMGAGAAAPFLIESRSAANCLFLNVGYFLLIGIIALWGAGIGSAIQVQLKAIWARRFSTKTPSVGTRDEV